jgi:hypothetical protein
MFGAQLAFRLGHGHALAGAIRSRSTSNSATVVNRPRCGLTD